MKRQFIGYDPKLKAVARKLRSNATIAEILLWQQLKGQRVCDYDFHRQRPIDRYIVDFFSPKLMLAIEIDGISHAGKELRDRQRQQRLENLGVRFLRFQDTDVRNNMTGVIAAISEWIAKHTPSPTPEGGV